MRLGPDHALLPVGARGNLGAPETVTDGEADPTIRDVATVVRPWLRWLSDRVETEGGACDAR